MPESESRDPVEGQGPEPPEVDLGRPRRDRLGLLFAALGVILWSTAEVVTRQVVHDLTPLQLSGARFLIGSLVLLPFVPGELRRRSVRVTPGVLLHAAWISLIGVVLAGVSYQLSLRGAGAGVVATVYGASPLMVMFMAAPVLGERITAAKAVGLTIGLLGIVVLMLSRESPTFTPSGLFYAFVTTWSFASFTVLIKRFAGPFAGLPITAFCSAFGAAYLAVLTLLEADVETLANLPSVIGPVLYLGVGPTGLAFLFFFLGLERVEATHATSIVLLKPPLAVALAAWWLGEPVTIHLALSMGLIFLGLYTVISMNRWSLRRAG